MKQSHKLIRNFLLVALSLQMNNCTLTTSTFRVKGAEYIRAERKSGFPVHITPDEYVLYDTRGIPRTEISEKVLRTRNIYLSPDKTEVAFVEVVEGDKSKSRRIVAAYNIETRTKRIIYAEDPDISSLYWLSDNTIMLSHGDLTPGDCVAEYLVINRYGKIIKKHQDVTCAAQASDGSKIVFSTEKYKYKITSVNGEITDLFEIDYPIYSRGFDPSERLILFQTRWGGPPPLKILMYDIENKRLFTVFETNDTILYLYTNPAANLSACGPTYSWVEGKLRIVIRKNEADQIKYIDPKYVLVSASCT